MRYQWGLLSSERSFLQLLWGAQVPQALGGVARFSFLDICGLPLGAADYMALARSFHTVFITSIPAMSMQVSTACGDLVSATCAGLDLP